jgi:hypothetical protein
VKPILCITPVTVEVVLTAKIVTKCLSPLSQFWPSTYAPVQEFEEGFIPAKHIRHRCNSSSVVILLKAIDE